MSIPALAWARGVKTGSTSAKCVLFVLANYADPTGKCWPSQDLIAREAEQSTDTVQRRLRDLEEAGLIERCRRCRGGGRGRGRTADYYSCRCDLSRKLRHWPPAPTPTAKPAT
ncbi:helix-turn-helix domain-containing protein [Methyloceanibacter superfactus]|uniref:helix-turn-helix domain-containing protein n=1 Tax=Methyloceanibacter superfactus TaxID=1774969 RepID=UPI001300FA58